MWSSPTTGPAWKTYCATFTPTEETTYLAFEAIAAPDASTTGASVVYLDHMVAVDACP